MTGGRRLTVAIRGGINIVYTARQDNPDDISIYLERPGAWLASGPLSETEAAAIRRIALADFHSRRSAWRGAALLVNMREGHG